MGGHAVDTVRDREAPGSNPGPPTKIRTQIGSASGTYAQVLGEIVVTQDEDLSLLARFRRANGFALTRPAYQAVVAGEYCHGGMARLPDGTITFLLTDLKGSTQAWDKQPGAMRKAMARHDAILADTVDRHAGELVEAGREGDSVLAVFRTAGMAAVCALDIQKNFAAESWPEGLDLKVRVALHTGEAQLREGHYFGPALNRCARLLATCHPGQILLTKAVEAMLADEVPPEAELQDLGLHSFKDLARPEQVFQLNDLSRPSKFPAIQSLKQRHTNMPHYLTNFVGRAADLTALKSVLAQSRLVTLTGAGGSGKTRLAAELGRACLELWPGGVWWVELAPVTDSRQVPAAVVTALELPGRGAALDVITAWLAARRAVLVLDNCEHLIAACARFCEAALQRCAELTILATSREALGMQGETRWAVSSMASADSVQLFGARARLVVPNFSVTASNLQAVSQICDRLDGMPLAIELAAARLGMMTEQEILSQLSDRFRLLTGGNRTAPERQQTMIATIDWSYRLLGKEEAQLFRRLSVFRGGFTLESAQAICSDADTGSLLESLAGLVQKSMVVAEGAGGAGTRYRLLESQLAYAEEQLRETGDLELVRRRHYEYYRDRLAANVLYQIGPPTIVDPTPMTARVDWHAREAANVWTAIGWARNNVDDLGLSLVVGMGIGDITHARAVVDDLLAHSPAQGMVRARAFSRASHIAGVQRDYQAALQAAETSVALSREVGDVYMLAHALNLVGSAHQSLGHLAAAAETYDEAAAILKDAPHPGALAKIRNSVAMLAIHMSDYAAAADILVEVVATGRAEHEDWHITAYLDSLACAQLGLNDYRAAAASWKEALSIARRFSDDYAILYCLEGLSCVAGRVRNDDRSLRLAAAVKKIYGIQSLGSDPWVSRRLEESLRQSRSRLGTRQSEAAWNEGWAMTTDQAINYAIGQSEPEAVVGAGPLSRRQREVATLVAAGLTNREIAESLFIAERSAEGHVERIRNRLGVRSRTEVATWAVEHGLMAPPIKEKGTRDAPLSPQRRLPS